MLFINIMDLIDSSEFSYRELQLINIINELKKEKNNKLKSLVIVNKDKMEELKKHIHEMRPNLSESSIKTYSNILKNLYKDVFSGDLDYHKLLKESDKVMDHLMKVKYNVRKTILSALVCISEGPVQIKYRKQMLEDAHQYNALQKQNVMTEPQKNNWISWKEVEEQLESLKRKYYYIFKEKKPSVLDFLNLQKYIILACYVLIPPRRLQDFCLMKVSNFNKEKDNFYDKGSFHFRTYKTAKFLGLQIEKVPKTLEMLLRKWIAFTQNDNLFFDYYGKQFISSGLTKVLNSIFGKNISVNMLRHIYISEKSAPLMKELEKTAEEMGHSSAQAKLYVKKE